MTSGVRRTGPGRTSPSASARCTSARTIWSRPPAGTGGPPSPAAPTPRSASAPCSAGLADAGAAADSADDLLAEAARWLSGAQAATTPDAIELITDMLNRQLRQAARRGFEPSPAG
ncbi:hypothetical protein LUX33_41910 [Actinomadura madurae]|uniref:hypothetical protein n=1 Tax=Actinomadura madurae TaxID=1993 RepID=UPI0020D23BB0|nr:hypothetical protein [Actinomadura madurae]MCP9954319.1 hypothetical protein [Actinomadura madurae]